MFNHVRCLPYLHRFFVRYDTHHKLSYRLLVFSAMCRLHPCVSCIPYHQGLRERYETHHKLRYTDESLMAAAKFSSQYISDRFLPDKVRASGRGPRLAPALGEWGKGRPRDERLCRGQQPPH